MKLDDMQHPERFTLEQLFKMAESSNFYHRGYSLIELTKRSAADSSLARRILPLASDDLSDVELIFGMRARPLILSYLIESQNPEVSKEAAAFVAGLPSQVQGEVDELRRDVDYDVSNDAALLRDW